MKNISKGGILMELSSQKDYNKIQLEFKSNGNWKYVK